MIGVDLFCGAGGMSLGAMQAGVKIATAIDCDKHATSTYRKNHPFVDVKTCDIGELDQVCFRSDIVRTGDCFWRPPVPRILNLQPADP